MEPKYPLLFLAVAAGFTLVPHCGAVAETMQSALARAYLSNPDLNQQRANVRVRDEDAPKAWSGLLPAANIQAYGGPQRTDLRSPFLPGLRTSQPWLNNIFYSPVTGQPTTFQDEYSSYPRGAAFTASQPLFDGGRTINAVHEAESGILAARCSARQAEQATLQNSATVYMNVLRDTAVLSLRKHHISVLGTQLDHTRQSFRAGDLTSTDVAQAEASLQQARSEFFASQAQLRNSSAIYQQIIGVPPSRLEPATSIERLLPKSLDDAIAVAIVEHPSVAAAIHQAEAAEYAVNVAWSALAPTLSLDAQVSQQYDSIYGLPGSRQFTAAARATLNVPLYQRGQEYVGIRQAKELVGREQLNVEAQRRSARAAVVSSYSQLDTARSQISSDMAAVKAAEAALRGVRQEAKVGQRTTLDVLNAQQTLLNARVNLVISQRDRVVASYAALASMGRLSAENLNLNVAHYDPTLHFEQVKDKLFGVDSGDAK
jgi:outer membrane protein